MSKTDRQSQAVLCVVLKGYPRLSETFIAQEIRELERHGFNIQIVSLRHPYDPATHPIHDEIVADVLYLPEYLHSEPFRVAKAIFRCLLRHSFWRALVHFSRDLRRDRTRNRLRRFGQGCVMATEVPTQACFFYAHFMHTPASVTQYASLLTSTPWAISAHAKDIWTIPEWEKREKLNSIEWLVTCTRSNFEHLTDLSRSVQSEPVELESVQLESVQLESVQLESVQTDSEQQEPGTPTVSGTVATSVVNLVYHGIDLSRFASPPSRTHDADGRSEARSVTLLSVGRTVQKKGYSYLLHALVSLNDNLHWKFVHIGGGELTEELTDLSISLGIDQSISWMGKQPQSVVLEALQSADLFVLPSIIGEDGDRDGLPNVLMEAQSQKLACLSTNISGIPELIEHGTNGWLVNDRDVDQLTDALQKLITEPDLRKRLAEQGYKHLHANFSHTTCLSRLTQLLETAVNK